MKKIIQPILLSVFLGLIFMPIFVQADQKEEVSKKTGFYFEIDYPQNQIGRKKWLNLKLAPGQQQSIPVKLVNNTDHELTVELSLNGARTSDFGVIERGPTKFNPDRTLEYDLPELVSVPKEVILPANGEKVYQVAIKMPAESIEGIVTGGVRMMEKTNEKPKSGMIVNKFAFLFGVTLQTDENKIEPKLMLNQVYASQFNYRNVIRTEIRNIMPIEMTGLLYEAEIRKKDGDEVLYSEKNDHVELAPNSIMSYPIQMDGDEFVPGKYTASIRISNDVKEWKWLKDFTISNDEAERLNEQDVTIEYPAGPDWKKIILLVIIAVLALAIIVLMIFYMKGKHRQHSKK